MYFGIIEFNEWLRSEYHKVNFNAEYLDNDTSEGVKQYGYNRAINNAYFEFIKQKNFSEFDKWLNARRIKLTDSKYADGYFRGIDTVIKKKNELVVGLSIAYLFQKIKAYIK